METFKDVKYPLIIVCLFVLLVSGCATSPRFTSDGEKESNSRYKKENKEPKSEPFSENKKNVEPKAGTLEKVTGVASFYSEKFNGRKTANGEIYDMNDLTAAHETYPFNTIVRVVNLKNNKSVLLRINDRKPDLNGRIIDVSLKAAQELDMVTNGIAHVQVEVIEWGK